MSYFPMFVEMSGTKVLIAGGGTVALRKAEKLLPYGADITVMAPEICEELKRMEGITVSEKKCLCEDAAGYAMVIAATDDAEFNHRLAQFCTENRIPVNVVDDRSWCSFLFPSLVQSGKLSVGISTGGASPAAAIWMKQKIAGIVPEKMDEILDWLESLRPLIRKEVPSEQKRSVLFKKLFAECMEQGRPLDQQEADRIIHEEEDAQ